MIFGRIVCFFKGHRRGALVQYSEFMEGHRVFRCPRCGGNKRRYKIKPNVTPLKIAEG